MWVSAPLVNGNRNLDVQSATDNLCPAMAAQVREVLSRNGAWACCNRLVLVPSLCVATCPRRVPPLALLGLGLRVVLSCPWLCLLLGVRLSLFNWVGRPSQPTDCLRT
eukprot:113213-Chlamydomonas_euryale.AAC.2